MNTLKNIAIGVLAITTLLFGFLYFTAGSTAPGAGTPQPTGPQHYQMEAFLQGLQAGARGTPLSLYASGNCTLQANASIAATSSAKVSCTGVTLWNGATYTGAVGDIVDLQLAASTTLATQYVIKSAAASTTANGSIEVVLLNLTGGAATPAATPGFGSTTQFQIFR